MTVAERLVGVWRLVSFETHGPSDTVRHPFGRDAAGLLVYTATGHMSGQLMRRGRHVFPSSTITGGSDAEVSSAARGYVAYAGTYSVDDAANVVIHHVTMSLFPNLVGTDQRRLLTLSGDQLELRTPPEEGRTMILRWERTTLMF
jgi:Lipocalin-like domain